MVIKDGEVGSGNDEGLARVQLITEKKRQLERTADQVRQEISSSFERLIDKLRTRERQLLRQVDAVNRQQLILVQTNYDLLPSNSRLSCDLGDEKRLRAIIQDYGRIDLSNVMAIKDYEPHKAEDYADDVVNYEKSLKSDDFNVTKPVVIDIDCGTCDASVNNEDDDDDGVTTTAESATKMTTSPAVASTSRQCDENQGAAATSGTDYSPFMENDDDDDDENDDTDSYGESSAVDEKTDRNTASSKIFVNDNDVKNEKIINSINVEDANFNGNACGEQDKTNDGIADEHPIQIQQWLRQIIAETETEPIVNEIGRPIVGQFTKLTNNARSCHEFPVET